MKIMIVDDALFMREKIKTYLHKYCFETCEAQDGEEAIQKYKTEMPDIITMDITMPKMDGIEAVKRILEIDKGARIIMVTALGQEPFVIEAMKLGAKDFLVKPINEERLKASIDRLISSCLLR
ncbi:response regulator receiver protein [Pseudobacteroides cellulosolvens ATCC 35603 = DSM 2933]|uniref:Stage 0 sporulation protein A homolog n=2 Tax=Pseudobacteroides cellulosolvens TaxID=35825 RepID=A0A0L6JKK4_9FIRM|nr:response regulator receiver protein [Pseudobacteroides cellulosolvens ATCC 35603 = DSM 2933]